LITGRIATPLLWQTNNSMVGNSIETGW
jgi:hypothetical protein